MAQPRYRSQLARVAESSTRLLNSERSSHQMSSARQECRSRLLLQWMHRASNVGENIVLYFFRVFSSKVRVLLELRISYFSRDHEALIS